MTTYKRVLIASLSAVMLCKSAYATDCDNAMYRRYNPDKCITEHSASGFSFATTVAVASGTAALIGGAVALIGTSSHSDSSDPNVIQPTLPTYTMVGGDIDDLHLSAIFNNADYKKNAPQYNDIRVAYSLARGYTGADQSIAVFDSGKNTFHGANVKYLAGGHIAPNANVSLYTVADRNGDFESFYQIGETISSATANGSNIYNFSWSSDIFANQVRSRHHMEQLTDQHFINSLTDAANKNDAIFVWAAGNDYNSQSSALSAMPLHIPELKGHFVNVVAWDSNTGALADFSNACGITKNYCITAPGTDIETPSSSYAISGTSFATPIVSAAIAVIREAFPYMTAPQITSLLFDTARDLGDVGTDEIYGHGMLDLERATRPVGAELVPLSDGTAVALRAAHTTGSIAHNIKSKNIKFAFIDSYGRAFNTDLNNNIKSKNPSIGFERLRANGDTTMTFGNLEFGFKDTELLMSDGFLSTDSQNTITFIGINNQVHLGNTILFNRATIGTMNPTASAQSMINGFSDIMTGSISFGAKYNDFALSIGTTDTIINGNMYLRTPTGRRHNGEYTFATHSIDMTNRPSLEIYASYKFMTAGFVDNPYGTDEVYVIAKTKLQF